MGRRPVSLVVRAVAAFAFVLLAIPLVQDLTVVPATLWMWHFRLSDFQTLDDAVLFYRHLHTGISPVLALPEIAWQLAWGAPNPVAWALMRGAIVLAFAAAATAFARTRIELLLSWTICLLFVVAIARLKVQFFMVYDSLAPLCLLIFVIGVQAARRYRSQEALAIACCVTAGLSLAAAELMRAFVLFLVPLLLLHAYLALRGGPRRLAICLLAPLILVSGGWHAKLLALHEGQLLWSNHGGFNLYRAWNSVVDDWPDFVGVPSWQNEAATSQPFRGTGPYRMLNWNSREHTEKSRALTRATLEHVIRQPWKALWHVGERIGALVGARTSFYEWTYVGAAPTRGFLLWVYKPLVWGTAAWLCANGLILAALVIRRRSLKILASPHAALLVVGWSSIFFLAVGDAGEEARFLVSALPFLGALPRVFELRSQPEAEPERPVESGSPPS